MNNTFLFNTLATLESGDLPKLPDLVTFIEACAPQMYSGPVPSCAAELENQYRHEAGLPVCQHKILPPVNLLSSEQAAEWREELFRRARIKAQAHFGKRIYIRGLIEISNYCRQNCRYCGIRGGNAQAERFRLSPEQILECCEHGYELGFRTFVLQGGEDGWFTDARLAEIVRQIKQGWPDCAITLSVGEKTMDSYRILKESGADRFLLRHETADPVHYALLHPIAQSWQERMDCLKSLKACGYQTGAGFMVGSPWQTTECLAKDLQFLHEFQPEMVGIGPFIPHEQTPFASFPSGSVERTLVLLAIIRLMLPHAMLPSTTALGTAASDGRERGILAGGNVVMPNLSPKAARQKYRLYNNKLSEGAECADNLESLRKRMRAIGYEIVEDRGDFSHDDHIS